MGVVTRLDLLERRLIGQFTSTTMAAARAKGRPARRPGACRRDYLDRLQHVAAAWPVLCSEAEEQRGCLGQRDLAMPSVLNTHAHDGERVAHADDAEVDHDQISAVPLVGGCREEDIEDLGLDGGVEAIITLIHDPEFVAGKWRLSRCLVAHPGRGALVE